jgi:tyrosyl-tRNA synthetase
MLVYTKLCDTKSSARRLIIQGGARINNKVYDDIKTYIIYFQMKENDPIDKYIVGIKE